VTGERSRESRRGPRTFAILAWLAVALAAVFIACDSDSSDDGSASTGGSGGSDGSGAAAAVAAECSEEENGYPCSRADVDPSVLDLESQYVAQFIVRVENEGIGSAFDWISSQPGVVEAERSNGMVMFRLDGGMPFFRLEPQSTITWPTQAQPAPQADPSGQAQIRFEAPVSNAASESPSAVVGEGTSRENPQNRKRARFLTPFAWHGLSMFLRPPPDPITHLREIPDYNHSREDVTHATNEQVTPDAFADWAKYDAIFVETHGGRIDPHTFIATGVIEEYPPGSAPPEFKEICSRLSGPYLSKYAGVDCGIIPVSGKEYVTVGLLPPFFGARYPAGLERAIVYMGGCSSAADDDVAQILAGSTSAYVGWTDTTWAEREPISAALLVYMLVLHGRGETIEGALKTLANPAPGEKPLHGGPDFGPNGAYLGFFPAGGAEQKKLRLYDIPTLTDPRVPTSGPALLDGARLQIEGTAGDGNNDRVKLAVDLMGVIDPEDTDQPLPYVPAFPPPGSDETPSVARRSTPGGNVALYAPPWGNDVAVRGQEAAEGDATHLYSLRFFLDDQEIGSDNLGDAIDRQAEGATEGSAKVTDLGNAAYRYQFTTSLPFDVDPGGTQATLRVVVRLPEGGVSDYEVDVMLVPPDAGATITVGSQTWEFELDTTFADSGCIESDAGVLTGGFVDGDLLGVSFGAQLSRGGGDEIYVNVPEPLEGWIARADRAGMTGLHLLPEGQSQIDEVTFDGDTISGTATFIETRAFGRALRDKTPYPAPVAGTFEIHCG
jgi:hypothetical protein